MACYHPIPARQDAPGAVPILHPEIHTENLALPCGKCLGCRTAKATHWAHRCTHEAKLYKDNTFLTLTYDDDNLPPDGHLDALALQRFLKRLRRRATYDRKNILTSNSSGIRFFACGEYGEETQRPHYHALLFNCTFPNNTKTGKRRGRYIYQSEILNELWPYGRHEFGKADPEAANYIAQYNLKKQGSGDHDRDGVYRPAPFLRMSLRPGIGTKWLEKYKTDLTAGYLTTEGKRHAIPRTYLEKLKKTDPDLVEIILTNKQEHRLANPTDKNDPERLRAAEVIHYQRKTQTDHRAL